MTKLNNTNYNDIINNINNNINRTIYNKINIANNNKIPTLTLRMLKLWF